LAEVARNISLDRSGPIKSALLAGDHPQFEPLPNLSKHAEALAEAESQLQAAEVALAEIDGEDREAQADVNAAQDAVRASADVLLIAMADAVAQEVEALESRAVELRTSLGGGSFAPISTALRGAALSPALMRVLASTDAMEFPHNGVEDLATKRARKAWLRFIEELASDADAELCFDAPVEEEAQRAA
jgi:hypothetical protein